MEILRRAAMRKLIGAVILGVLIFFSYQWLQQSNGENQPAIIETIKSSVQDIVQAGGTMLKEELDSIEQRLAEEAVAEEEQAAVEAGRISEASGSASAGEINEIEGAEGIVTKQTSNSKYDVPSKLTTDDEQGIVHFLANALDERNAVMT